MRVHRKHRRFLRRIASAVIMSILLLIALIVLNVIGKSDATVNQGVFWQIQAIDTMKYSRDASRDPSIYSKIPQMVQQVANLHANYIAIATPYDEEFYPVLKAWVAEARKDHLKVWFRGNFSGWEGWFNYPQFSSIHEHNSLTTAFITRHPDLFQEGDIFTPLPEPENGGPGDPRNSSETPDAYNQMLVSSYQNCVQAFATIRVTVNCGYFSMNADVAKQVLSPETVRQIGNIVVIDHYVDSASQMDEDLTYLENKFPSAQIILGEFGAPIPDINGDMTQDQQAAFINQLLQVFYNHRSRIGGLDYWTLQGGSTALLNDDGSQKKAAQIIDTYYLPTQVTGHITDTLGDNLSNVLLKDQDSISLGVTDKQGDYVFPTLTPTQVALSFYKDGYKTIHSTYQITNNKIQTIVLEPLHPSIVYTLRVFLKNLTSL